MIGGELSRGRRSSPPSARRSWSQRSCASSARERRAGQRRARARRRDDRGVHRRALRAAQRAAARARGARGRRADATSHPPEGPAEARARGGGGDGDEPLPLRRRDRGVPRAGAAGAAGARGGRLADRGGAARAGRRHSGSRSWRRRTSRTACSTPTAGDLALVVAAHGSDEVATLRAGLEADVRWVGLVASRKRGAGVVEELRAEGVPRSCSTGSRRRPGSTSAPARRPRSRWRSWPGSSRCAGPTAQGRGPK